MSTIGYIRVSTDAQNLARQEALMQSLGIEKIYREKLSGKDANRPALKAMLEYVREGDALHVESLSRLGRSTRDVLTIVDQLTAKGVALISHKESFDTSTPQGRFVLSIFAALSELERETTLQRVQEGVAAAKAAGKRFGRPPVEKPVGFDAIASQWRAGEITAVEAMRRTGLKKTAFYASVKPSPTPN